MILLAFALATQFPIADLIVENGRIWTDGHLTKHTGFALKDGRFIALGGDLSKYAGPSTRRIDAKGNWVLPGLIDSHTHLANGCVGFAFGLDLRPAKSKSEFVTMVEKQAAKLGPKDWVEGRGWSVESYPDKAPPTRAWIDEVTGGRPAKLVRMDGHSLLANSKALAFSGITKDGPPDPPGGRIERDPVTKEPTGLLADTAMGLIRVPGPSEDLRDRALPEAIKEAHRYGVTASGDITSAFEAPVWFRYMKRDDRAFRIGLYINAAGPRDVAVLAKLPRVEGWLEPRGVKMYMDGSLGSRSAYMAGPFNKPLPTQPKDWRGLALPGATDGTYAAIIAAAARANVQVIIHAIGDQANHDVLDLFEKAPDLKNLRFRVEHVQHLKPADIPRFGKLGVIPSLQPYHKADDGRYCEDVIGTERSRTSYAFRDLNKSGASLAFGSDFPVVTINPWVGIATAVTGVIDTGKVWMPHQNVSLDVALDAYTRGAAYACKMENQIGRIAPGYFADFIVLGQKLNAKGIDLGKVRPKHVFVNGREVTAK